MNAKLIFKTVFLIIILLLLVIMGMNNRDVVSFVMPPFLVKSIRMQAAYMYFAFFAIGVLTGTILTAGGGKKGGSASGKSKSDK